MDTTGKPTGGHGWHSLAGLGAMAARTIGTVDTNRQPRSGGSSRREHHHTTSFEEETINILRRHEIEFDRKYLFETEHHG